MAEQNAPPSINPADQHSLAGMLKLVLLKHLQATDDMLPAKVLAYNKTTNRASVQPLITVVTTDNRRINRAGVASVPVYQPSAGGFILRFPIKPGSLGWIKANDRDISIYKSTLKNSSPNTQRKHSFEDAMFIPDAMFQMVTIAEEDEDCVVLQSIDGAVRISLGTDKLKLTAPEIEIDTPLLTLSNDAGNINIGGIDFLNHVHTGVDPGSGESDGPANP